MNSIKNQTQNLPYSGTTQSSLKNSKVSGYYDHSLNTFILKCKKNNLNNQNIYSVSLPIAGDPAEGGKKKNTNNFIPLHSSQPPVPTAASTMGVVSTVKVSPSETSFKHLTVYSNNLNSQFSKFNNKNQIILNLKKVAMCTVETELEQANQNILRPLPFASNLPALQWAEGSVKALPSPLSVAVAVAVKGGRKVTLGGAEAPQNKKSTLISKGTEYLGGINILTPVKINNNTTRSPFYLPTLPIAGWGEMIRPNVGQSGKTNPKLNMDITISKYLKSFGSPQLEKFNLDIATSQYLVYNFNNSKQKLISNITSILKNSFYSMYSLISRPVLDITPNKIIINLFFFVSRNKNKRQIGNSYNNLKFLSKNHKQLQILCSNLSKYLKKPVELELIRLYYPYNDSQILANTIGRLSKNIRNRFRSLVDNTFNFSKIKNPTKLIMAKKPRISILPSFLTGIKIRLGGRLLSQKVIPRFSVQTFQEGSLARTKANIVTSSRFTHKNKRGTFSVTVSVGHGFF